MNTPDQDAPYRAFLSYSHRDEAPCARLHRRLESYRVPKRLVGRDTRAGPVPRRLAPIFRDREELPTSANLGEMIVAALRDSLYLVVACSPRSAQSRWVNEEILAFKRLGRSDNVLAIILDGEPNASDDPTTAAQECFPPALRFRMGTDGVLTDIRSEPIAADARESGDGPRDAMLKVVAGLLGVGFDELKQRELQRRQRRLMQVAIGSVVAVLVLLGLTVWALGERGEARRQTVIARENQRQSNQRLTNSHVDKGWMLAGRGRWPMANLWFTEALATQPGDAADELVHRVRLGWVRRHAAHLLSALVTPQSTRTVFSRDGRRVIANTPRAYAVMDIDSGATLATIPIAGPSRSEAVFGADDQIVFVLAETLSRWSSAGQRTHEWELGRAPGHWSPGVVTEGVFGGLAASPDGKVIVVANGDHALVLDGAAADPEPRRVPIRSTGWMSLDPTGRWIAVADNAEVVLHSLADGAELARLLHPQASQGPDPRLGQPRRQGSGRVKVVFSPDGSRLATYDRVLVQVWETRTGKAVGIPLIPGARPTSAVLIAGGTAVIVGDASGASHNWNVDTGVKQGRAHVHARPLEQLRFFPKAKLLLGLGGFFQVDSKTVGSVRITPIGPVQTFTLRESARQLVSQAFGWIDQKPRSLTQVWQLPLESSSEFEVEGASSVAAHPDSTVLLVASAEGRLRSVDVFTGDELAQREFAEPVEAMQFLPGGASALVSAASGRLEHIDVQTLTPLGLGFSLGSFSSTPVVSPSGALFASIVSKGRWSPEALVVWTVAGVEKMRLPAAALGSEQTRMTDIAWHPSEGLLAIVVHAGEPGGQVQIVEVASGHARGTPLRFAADVTDLEFSPAGDSLLVALHDNSARLVRLDGTPICGTTPGASFLYGARFDPSGSRLLTWSGDSSARIWDAATGQALVREMRHDRAIKRAVYSQSGRIVATTCDEDHTVGLWDARTGARLVAPMAGDVGVFAAGERRFVTRKGAVVSVWSLEPDDRTLGAIRAGAERDASRRLDPSGGELLLEATEMLERLGEGAVRGR